jgi:hypothetical protein
MPMMSDPSKYRRTMYQIFWEGKTPEKTPEERREHAKRVKAGIGKTKMADRAADLAALDKLEKFSAQLRGEEVE